MFGFDAYYCCRLFTTLITDIGLTLLSLLNTRCAQIEVFHFIFVSIKKNGLIMLSAIGPSIYVLRNIDLAFYVITFRTEHILTWKFLQKLIKWDILQFLTFDDLLETFGLYYLFREREGILSIN